MKPWTDEIRTHIENWSIRLGPLRWWPRFVYHFTDVQNAASIITTGCLYSRMQAEQQGLMKTDNASSSIIEQTHSEYTNFVRLYFRPRTPTQYRNEGIRPIGKRELGAHCAVPVFFCFDALAVLSQDDVRFSNGNMARAHVVYGLDRDLFFNIPFHLVFHTGWFAPEQQDQIIFHRNAEILIPNRLPLFPTLKFVACRSAAERQTLLSLLSDDIARQWAPLIRLGIQGLFERKWTYVEEVVPTENQIIFRFNPDTKTPGPFQVYLSYNEEKRETGWIWTGQKDMLQDSWSVKIRDAKWGQVVLRLDDSLAFQGTLVFDSVPF